MNYLFYFIGLIFIKIRLKLHKEHAKRWRERFVTINQHFNNNNETIWVHAVSLGEVKSAINMIKKFSNDGFNIILTTNTVISAEFIDTIVIQNMIHQFFPIPYNSNILKFLKYWKPKKIYFFEKEIWPNIINIAYKNKIEIYLINAQISDKSFRNWRIFKFYIENVLNKYTNIFIPFNSDERKFISLGLKQNKIIKSVHTKFDNMKEYKVLAQAQMNDIENINFINFINNFNNKKIIIFASLHEEEEQFAITSLKEIYNFQNVHNVNIISIIAIRHNIRSVALQQKLKQNNLQYVLFTDIIKNNITINDINSKIILVDIFGKMPLLYILSDIAIVCGSFVANIGGHNVLEPLSLNKYTISGNYFHKNYDLINGLLKDNKIRICNQYELVELLIKNLF